ncbi:hypothetical protein ATCC90586_005922 [Pythium insidiosum]|nr:hypothetical protein ATCC90586_005922 [Pythium insidiosum]
MVRLHALRVDGATARDLVPQRVELQRGVRLVGVARGRELRPPAVEVGAHLALHRELVLEQRALALRLALLRAEQLERREQEALVAPQPLEQVGEPPLVAVHAVDLGLELVAPNELELVALALQRDLERVVLALRVARDALLVLDLLAQHSRGDGGARRRHREGPRGVGVGVGVGAGAASAERG